MPTVNFSVPERVKTLFNEAFKGRNKSAIIAELMQEAVERECQRVLHIEALDRIIKRRATLPLPTGRQNKERRRR